MDPTFEFRYGVTSESYCGWDLNWKEHQDKIVEECLILVVSRSVSPARPDGFLWGICDPIPVTEKEETEAVFRGLARGQFFPAPIRFEAYRLTERFVTLTPALTGMLTVTGRHPMWPQVRFDFDPLWKFMVSLIEGGGPLQDPSVIAQFDSLFAILRRLDSDAIDRVFTRMKQIVARWPSLATSDACTANEIPSEDLKWLRILNGQGYITATELQRTLKISRGTLWKYKKIGGLKPCPSLGTRDHDSFALQEVRQYFLRAILTGRQSDWLREKVVNLCDQYHLRPPELMNILF